MEKKKLKLSISGSSKKTINSIEQAKSQSKNTVVIEKKPRFGTKPNYSRPNTSNERPKGSAPFVPRNNTFSKPTTSPSSDFERRKLAEQRATRRLKGEITPSKDAKIGKGTSKRRELKLTVSRALDTVNFNSLLFEVPFPIFASLLGVISPFNLLVALCSASFLLSKSELGEVVGLEKVLFLGTKGALPLGLSFDVFGLE